MAVLNPGMILAGACLAMAIGWTSPVAAQEISPDDEAKVVQCLEAVRKADSDPRACVGVVADPCLETPEETSNAENIACMTRETRIWQRLLEMRYTDLQGALETEVVEDLDAVQEAWQDYRTRRCEFGARIYADDSLADFWTSDCHLEETGRRAIELGRLLEEVRAR